MLHLKSAVRVLVYGKRVDHPDGLAFVQPLQFRDDLAVKIRVTEPRNEELHRSNRHAGTPFHQAT